MKTKLLAIVGGVLLGATLPILIYTNTGCASTPYAWEQKLYNIKTNHVPVAVPSYTTEVNGKLVEIAGITNSVEQYEYEVSDSAGAVQGIGKMVGSFWGVGDLVSLALGGIFGLWGTMRGKKANKTSAALLQVIETGRKILETTPQGQDLDDQWVRWMMKHQAEKGVFVEVTKLLGQYVNSDESKRIADELVKLMDRKADNQPTA